MVECVRRRLESEARRRRLIYLGVDCGISKRVFGIVAVYETSTVDEMGEGGNINVSGVMDVEKVIEMISIVEDSNDYLIDTVK